MAPLTILAAILTVVAADTIARLAKKARGNWSDRDRAVGAGGGEGFHSTQISHD